MNHQALDAVEDRLKSIAPDVDFLVRTLDPRTERDVGMPTVLETLVKSANAATRPTDPSLKNMLRKLAGARSAAIDLIQERRELHLRLADHIERRETIAQLPSDIGRRESVEANRKGLLARIIAWLRFALRSPQDQSEDTVPQGAPLRLFDSAIERDRKALRAISEIEDPVELTKQISEVAKKFLPRYLASRASLGEEERLELTNDCRDLELIGTTSLTRELVERVIGFRPLWLASILGVPKRIPLHDGLFDIVIFDEASQCDVASSLPLFARARRAVVVGDDRQLAFIPRIGVAQDRNLMAAQNLPRTGMGRFAQGRVSLFDLARSVPGVPAVMLRDQYRSAPDIVDYINRSFYGGRLCVASDTTAFKVPPKGKPGLAWTDSQQACCLSLTWLNARM